MFAATKGGAVNIISKDSQFNLNTVLLHGDGSNGANNSVFQDSSTNAFTLTRTGTPTQGSFSPFSQTGWSAYFSGSSSSPDFVSTASSSTFNVSSGNWTVEAWFWTGSSDASNRYITFIPASGTAYGLIPSGSDYVINQFGTSSPISTSGSLLKKSQWTHVAIVKNGATTYIYVDGVLGGSGTVSWSNSAHTIFFGGNGTSYTYNYSGWISNARIVMGTALYTGSTYTVPTSPLTAVAGTQFLTLNNNRIYDSSGNNATVNLGVTTGPAVQSFSPFAPSSAYGVSSVGGSMYTGASATAGIGTGSLCVASNSAINIGTGAFTVEFWVYQLSHVTGNYGNYFGLNNYTNGINWSDRVGTDPLYIAGTYYNWYPTTNVLLNQWTHMALVRNGSGAFRMFVNGKSVLSGTNSADLGSSAPIAFGDVPPSMTAAGYPTSAYMSGMRMTNTAVYDPTLTTCTVPTSPPTAISGTLFLCNATNAGIYDSTAKNNLISAGLAQISTAQKKYGTGSMYFTTTGDGFTIPATSLTSVLGSGNFTIEFWMLSTQSATQIDLIRSTTWAIVAYTNSQLYWQSAYGVTSLSNYPYGTLFNGSWHHVAVVRNGTALTMYVDGTALGTAATDNNSYTTSSAITIGIGGSYGQFLGYMDDIRITNGYARYTSTFTPPSKAFANQ